MIQRYDGTLRLKITPIAGGVQIQVFDAETGETVWQEGLTPPPNCSIVSQISFSGTAQVVPGYWIDPEGKRHFVMKADTAREVNRV